MSGLHRTCAVWFAEVGRPAAAVEHALAAGDWPFAARLLVDDLVVARLLAHGSVPELPTPGTLPAGVPVCAMAWLHNGTHLAAGTGDRILGTRPGHLLVWDLAKPDTPVKRVPEPHGVWAVAGMSAGKTVFCFRCTAHKTTLRAGNEIRFGPSTMCAGIPAS